MAVIVAARKPEYNIQVDDSFNWWVSIFYPIANGFTGNSEITIIKRSPTVGVFKQLKLNVSPIAKDFFFHIPELTTPIEIQDQVISSKVDISLASTYYNIDIFATYDAYDGWEVFLANVVGVSNVNVVKKLFINSPQYISSSLFNTDNIMWLLDDGSFEVENNSFENVEISTVFPVIHPSLTIDDSINKLFVIGRDAGNQELWRLEYQFECPFDDALTIGFINKYGLWEFIDLTGNRITRLLTDRETYTRFDTGSKQDYNVNGSYEYEFNTGWVDKGFEDVIEGLMLSENVIIYSGDGEDPINIVIDTKDMKIQDSRTDKMVNYNFKAKVGKLIIPLI